jgi:CubicO group peptidase (beta-lactamase class C family)
MYLYPAKVVIMHDYFKKYSLYHIFLLISILYYACGSSDPTDPSNSPKSVSVGTADLKIVSGNNQSTYVNEFLTNPVILKLTKPNGDPIPDARIQFVPGEGEEKTEITDTIGQVYYNWQLGVEYEQKLMASYLSQEDNSITVEAFATALYRYHKPEENEEWPIAHVNAFDIDTVPLMNMVDAIRSQAFPRIHSVHLAKEGQLILEENFPRIGESSYTGADSELHYIASVTKSFTSILVGIALDEGLINSIETSLYSFFPEYKSFENWSDLKDSISLRDALLMRSGLGCADDGAWESTPDFVKTTLDLPVISEPGNEWRYCSMLTHVLGSVVANASGMNLAEYAKIRLWDPLGITQIRWTYSPAGRTVTGYGFWMRPRDMLKFGQLMLNDGEWQGMQIVSKAWIEEAITGWPTGLEGDYYGYQWWVRPAQSAGAPAFYYAAGNGGQMIFIVPEKNLVAVFTGGNYDSRLMNQPVTLLERYVLPAVR